MIIDRLLLPPLCLLEKLYNRGTRCRLVLWCVGLALVAGALQFAALVWLAYAVLALPVLLHAAHGAKTWQGRAGFLLLGAALAMFGLGRALWFFWPKYLDHYVVFLDLGHFALIVHAAMALLSTTPRGREALGLPPLQKTKETPDAERD